MVGYQIPWNIRKIRSFTGKYPAGHVLVTLCNRLFDYALIELKMRFSERIFRVRATPVLVGEHTLSRDT